MQLSKRRSSLHNSIQLIFKTERCSTLRILRTKEQCMKSSNKILESNCRKEFKSMSWRNRSLNRVAISTLLSQRSELQMRASLREGKKTLSDVRKTSMTNEDRFKRGSWLMIRDEESWNKRPKKSSQGKQRREWITKERREKYQQTWTRLKCNIYKRLDR